MINKWQGHSSTIIHLLPFTRFNRTRIAKRSQRRYITTWTEHRRPFDHHNAKAIVTTLKIGYPTHTAARNIIRDYYYYCPMPLSPCSSSSVGWIWPHQVQKYFQPRENNWRDKPIKWPSVGKRKRHLYKEAKVKLDLFRAENSSRFTSTEHAN